jgi:hypothetical protein
VLCERLRRKRGWLSSQLRRPLTYFADEEAGKLRLRQRAWPDYGPHEPLPVLLRKRARQSTGQLSAMFLAESSGEPVPDSEITGLVLLRKSDVQAIVIQALTFGDFLSAGGQALLREPVPEYLPMRPLFQVRALASLLSAHPDLFTDLMDG